MVSVLDCAPVDDFGRRAFKAPGGTTLLDGVVGGGGRVGIVEVAFGVTFDSSATC